MRYRLIRRWFIHTSSQPSSQTRHMRLFSPLSWSKEQTLLSKMKSCFLFRIKIVLTLIRFKLRNSRCRRNSTCLLIKWVLIYYRIFFCFSIIVYVLSQCIHKKTHVSLIDVSFTIYYSIFFVWTFHFMMS
jgi:hypothetical protein